MDINIPIWIRFPKLDDCYYRALPDLCSIIGSVVWYGKREDYLQKSSTPRVCILTTDVRSLPSTLTLPVSLEDETVEITLEYEGIPNQCGNCFGVDHLTGKCRNKKVRFRQPSNQPSSKSSKAKDTTKEKSGKARHDKSKEPTKEARHLGSRLMEPSKQKTHKEYRIKNTGQQTTPTDNQDMDNRRKLDTIPEAMDIPAFKDNTLGTSNSGSPDPTQSECETIGVTEAEVAGFMETLAQNAGLCDSSEEVANMPPLCQDKNINKKQTPSKKRPSTSTVLTDRVWDTLNFQYTPPDGERRLQIWPVIHTQGSNGGQIRYLSLLQGELQATRVSFATNTTPSFEEACQVYWEQLQCDLTRNLGVGCKSLLSRPWETIQWVEKRQAMEDGSSICHVLALLNVNSGDDNFHFNETRYKWTDCEFLRC